MWAIPIPTVFRFAAHFVVASNVTKRSITINVCNFARCEDESEAENDDGKEPLQ
jgi:hypothetical protein